MTGCFCNCDVSSPESLTLCSSCGSLYNNVLWTDCPTCVLGTPKMAGHPDKPSKFEEIALKIGKLVAEKNLAYGDSFSKSGAIMKILYPEGIPVDQIDNALAIVRIVDKLFRIATDKDAFGESPFGDIAGYGILGVASAKEPRKST